MKALSVLGTSSSSGKSWVATALCALLRRRGLRVAPFKAQNMSNNSYATLTGGEIGRAQAVQAEACGMIPSVEMNPILLKPSGAAGSQLVLLGEARGHVAAADYYRRVDELWPVVTETLEYWRSRCDVLILEGAGSPVELNLMDRDLVNLRPVRHLDGRWVLVSDVERGGVFAQVVGTYQLLPEKDRARGLGAIANKFRGDISLFAGAPRHLAENIPLPYLGVLPYRGDLQPESEDSLCCEAEEKGHGDTIAWIRFPYVSNTSDVQPWLMDEGVRTEWISRANQLRDAKAIVLPGSKNTLADLEWLRESGLAEAIKAAAAQGIPVIGICGGFQMLGATLHDERGLGGRAGREEGLNLLPVATEFQLRKEVKQVAAAWKGARDQSWKAYEIHMGRSKLQGDAATLLEIKNGGGWEPEGCRQGKVWGTYLHGFFESAAVRSAVAWEAGLLQYKPASISWRDNLQEIYQGMADLLEEKLKLEEIWRYVDA
jgi:adenosylcobyric acid synthase